MHTSPCRANGCATPPLPKYPSYCLRAASFGVLRVLNDDLVQGLRGFGRHPHRDMEIITYIVEGSLTHADSTGTRETLGCGSVQFMTAGSGIYHSEHNEQDSPLRFCQIWITPRVTGLTPCYGGYDGTPAAAQAARHNALAHLVGDANNNAHAQAPVRIQQDCSLYVAELEAGQTVSLALGPKRQAYLVCLEGSVSASDSAASDKSTLRRHDAVEVRGEGCLQISASDSGAAHVLLLEMAAGGGGRGPGKWPLHMG